MRHFPYSTIGRQRSRSRSLQNAYFETAGRWPLAGDYCGQERSLLFLANQGWVLPQHHYSGA